MNGKEGLVPTKGNTSIREHKRKGIQKQGKARTGQEQKENQESQRRLRGEGVKVGKREQEKKEIGGKESINEEEMVMESGT